MGAHLDSGFGAGGWTFIGISGRGVGAPLGGGLPKSKMSRRRILSRNPLPRGGTREALEIVASGLLDARVGGDAGVPRRPCQSLVVPVRDGATASAAGPRGGGG